MMGAYRWPLKTVIEEEARGIAEVRNRLVAEALESGAQFIAMIDDDEWPEENWIDELLHAQKTVSSRSGAGFLFCSAIPGQTRSPIFAMPADRVAMAEGAAIF